MNWLPKLFRWYRSLPIFDWHNKEIRKLKRELVSVKEHKDVLQERIDSWIARSEGSRYKELYLELKNKPHHLEAHANKQAKIINWIQAHMSTMYPRLVEKAREHIKDG